MVGGNVRMFKYYVIISLQNMLNVSPLRIARLDVRLVTNPSTPLRPPPPPPRPRSDPYLLSSPLHSPLLPSPLPPPSPPLPSPPTLHFYRPHITVMVG